MRKILALAAALTLCGGTALAVPYASQIRVSTTSVFETANQTISYILNEDADTVLIEILDSGDAVIATFPGTADQGFNQVVWDLTNDNSGGTPVGIQTGLRVRITVDANKAEEWHWYAINQSPDHLDDYWNEPPLDAINHKNLFNRVRGHSVHIPWDQDADSFGLVLITSSHSAGTVDPGHGMVVKVTTDMHPPLESLDGGRDTSVLSTPAAADPNDLTFQDTWYMTEDPLNPGHYYVNGQGNISIYYGTLDDPVGTTVMGPGPSVRTMAAAADGTDRIVYLAHGNNTIDRGVIGPSNELDENDLVNILGIATPTLYSKHVMLDADGNLYWLSRVGWVYRWPASVVENATTAGFLTEANADWIVDATGILTPSGVQLYELAETPDGDIIVSTREGLINLGNRSDAIGATVVTGLDVFFEFPSEMPLNTTFGSGLYSDAFGNIYFTDGATQTALAYAAASPGGNTSTTVTAPTSQTFEITDAPTEARNWHLYR